MRKFYEICEEEKRTTGQVTLPTRATKGSAGYDFYANTDYKIKPNEIGKIWTDVVAEMNEDEVLLLNVRSSMGGKFRLANTLGVIDSDYKQNIGIFLLNTSNEVQHIHKGDRVGQGIFVKYLTVDEDYTYESRDGGFGSTGK